MKTYLLPALAALLLLAACKKDDADPDGLVAATQEGRNTGDFLLNGTPFNPQPRVSSPADKPVSAFWDNFSRGRSIRISFFRQERDISSTERIFDLNISNVKSPGTFQLRDAVVPNVIAGLRSYAVYEVPGVYPAIRKYYLTGPNSPSQVIITRFDTVSRVVSGTFEAKLREYQGPDSLVITKGRFDCTF